MEEKRLLLTTAFVTGTILMALEMIGSRLLAPYFGNSIYVWGNLIGIIMVSMSLGYFLGGKRADISSSHTPLYTIIFMASIWILMMLFIYRPLLSYCVKLGTLAGSIVSTVSLFAVPMILLSMTPPIVIKLFSINKKVGSTVGLVNSVSTIGSILGVYLASFIMIPHIGTRLSLQVCFFSLLLISAIGLTRLNKKYILLLLFTGLLALTPTYALSKDILMSDESLYNHIIVKNNSGEIYLMLNTQKYIHSVYNEEFYRTGRYYQYFLLMPEIKKTDDMLILGMGAGTSVDQFRYFYPEISIDAVEIDKSIVDVADRYFSIREDEKLDIIIEDARTYLVNNNKKYDIIEIDLFQGSPYIPFYVTTKEFFTLANSSLEDDGLIGMNILKSEKDTRLRDAIECTIMEVFPSVFRIDSKYNYVVIASKEEMDENDIARQINDQTIMNPNEITITKIRECKGIVLTDDKAPVELLTKNAISD